MQPKLLYRMLWRMYWQVFACLSYLQVPASLIRMAHLRGMERDSLNQFVPQLFGVNSVSRSLLLPMEAKRNALTPPWHKVLPLCLFQGAFLKLAWQMYRLPQCKAGDSCYFLTGVSLCPAPVLRVKQQDKAVTLESVCEGLHRAFPLPFYSIIHFKG